MVDPKRKIWHVIRSAIRKRIHGRQYDGVDNNEEREKRIVEHSKRVQADEEAIRQRRS
jgi:hypothetical protein